MAANSHKWQKGQSGNPKGRPKGSFSLTWEMKKYLSEVDPDSGKTNGRLFIENVVMQASMGNSEAMRQVLNRLEGPVPKEIDVTLSNLTDAELRARCQAILAGTSGAYEVFADDADDERDEA